MNGSCLNTKISTIVQKIAVAFAKRDENQLLWGRSHD